MQHCREEIHVGIGLELNDFAHLGLDPTRVDESHGSTALFDSAQSCDWIRHRQKRPLTDSGVRTEEKHVVGVVDIGNEVDLGTSPEHLGDSEFVRTVLAAGGEQAGGSEHCDEQRECWSGSCIKCCRVSDVAGDGVWSVFSDDGVDSLGDVGGCVVPCRSDKSAGGAALRFVESRRIVMNLAAQHALVAGKSFCDGMIVVGTHLLYCPVVGDIDDNAAAGLA
ncbi:unannotated protein [freshwater metagenome]|uniref:Unannotated protein n=1 Tax=freshwater metagenome TaxID=449393 RepID=A0A6J6F3D9_9ZZZZ